MAEPLTPRIIKHIDWDTRTVYLGEWEPVDEPEVSGSEGWLYNIDLPAPKESS